MPKGKAMSRTRFLEKVEQLLGKFDSDSYMRGFTHGFDRALDLAADILADTSYDFTRMNVQTRIKLARKRRR